jgi:hypothetical protein
MAFGLGILSGVLLNLTRDPSVEKLLPWDPLVLTTSAMFLWLLTSGLVGLAYRPAREGHKVAYWTLVGVVFLVIALLILLLNSTQHGGVKGERAETPRVARPAVLSTLPNEPAAAHEKPAMAQADRERRRTDIAVCRRGCGVNRSDAEAARVLDRQQCLSSCLLASRWTSLDWAGGRGGSA